MEVFVTVGTTSFERLLKGVTQRSVLQALKKRGFAHMTLQIGNSQFSLESDQMQGIKIDYYKFKDSIADDIEKADLVISHAGAGSCLEALEAGKKLLVVINDELMDNHQLELAEQLAELGYLYHTTSGNILWTLENVDFSLLKTYPEGNSKAFARHIDEFMGFVAKDSLK